MNGRSRGRRALWISVLTGSVVVIVAAAAVLITVRPWTEEFRHGGLRIAALPAPMTPSPQLAAASPSAPAPTPQGLSAALAGVAGSPDLGAFSASVSDPDSRNTLWSVDPGKPVIPASTAKVLTAAAALLVVPPDHRVTTSVVTGSTPNELVLIAGGDPTLTAQADGKGYYKDGPRLADLVAQVKASGRPADSIVVDTSVFTGPAWPAGWDPADIEGGSWAPIEPVMIDGGRKDPLVEYSPRTPTPALDAGRRLAAELGMDPAKVRLGSAPAGAAEVAKVQSAPLRDRLQEMMIHSDDVLAETIGREIATVTGNERSFAGAAAATTTALSAAGFDTTGSTLLDNSGLSTDDRIPARLLDRVLMEAAAPQNGTTTAAQRATTAGDSGSPLSPLLDYLPVAAGTGSLAYRFVTPRDHTGAGWVRAKTGTLSVSSALAGYVLDSDGRVLTFALMSNDRPPEASRPALDAIAAALRNCGCS
ncbi:D-alanyl-D-alanine carboxypeptidase/D-alanyl-D-alanine-endopeptidase (penicillin-binding protein 4) [Nocardia transvalensis]|uniref:D-alanyl-D-alanine carboxypeptidase/D-alanyl-D-alanine-endopeptidase (Penicillin-binding protein 4) n=1 Tax=Nocardia transvalensis TaxID=37333 RepID=A0A7W9UHH5_9NOCA|nr:D-alanyl-D-alanine carboxypeptidase/D-alanyl-D-alanine-endopeptidase [Nocardia transvalensis]MBB5913369.1 D-alanyl-D-alanine carboxypeptidase/D-alanyl-D-alanine-endopeptidase (penicillin-binding protein 4) [Nocardia transvalensis]